MPFMKYAAASVIHTQVSKSEWGNIRVAAKHTGQVNGNLIERASEFLGKPFNPEDFLLTHATIIASVETYDPPGVKTGSVLEDGFRVDRKFADFRVKPDSDKFINNNLDCWSRPVLLASYQTFVGGHNFVEHIQMEEQSRGRIIDAVARDIGDSVYVDILIATDRKHRDLVAAIKNGRMGTLSMGCTVDGTICTKCGHWAADETEMCPHVKYSKGNRFFDEQGAMHRVAELCGHKSIGPTGGVHFIEASWVGTPAFTGAVLRNVLEPTAEISKKAQQVLSTPPPQWNEDAVLKAASVVGAVIMPRSFAPASSRVRLGDSSEFLAGWMDEGDAGGEGETAPPEETPPAPEAKPKAPFQEVEDEIYTKVKDRVLDRFKKDLSGDAMIDMLTPEKSSMQPNESLIRAAAARTYRAGLEVLLKTASDDASLLDRVATFNKLTGIDIPVPIYRVALKVGCHNQYSSVQAFQEACSQVMGRSPTLAESKTLLRLSRLLSRRAAENGSTTGSRHRSER
jgi:hypothetical protein